MPDTKRIKTTPIDCHDSLPFVSLPADALWRGEDRWGDIEDVILSEAKNPEGSFAFGSG